MTRKQRAFLRFVASVALCVMLLPYVLRLYLTLSPNAKADDVWLSLVQAAPFGERIATLVIAVWGEAQSGVDSLLEFLASQKFSFPQYFTMELGELIFTSVVVLLISSVIGRKLFNSTEGGFWDYLANAVFQVFLTFCASLVVDVVLDTFTFNLPYAENLIGDLAAWGYGLSLGTVGVVMLVLCGVIFLDAILLVAIGCFKLSVSYGFFLWMLLVQMQGGSGWMLAVGVTLWLVMIWLLQALERLFLPQ